MKELTDNQKDLLHDMFRTNVHRCVPIEFISKEQVEREDNQQRWIDAGKPYSIIVGPVVDREVETAQFPDLGCADIIGCFDVAYGWLCLWDGTEWHIGKQEVVTKDWVFLADYHGFPDGRIYKQVA